MSEGCLGCVCSVVGSSLLLRAGEGVHDGVFARLAELMRRKMDGCMRDCATARQP